MYNSDAGELPKRKHNIYILLIIEQNRDVSPEEGEKMGRNETYFEVGCMLN